jgi:hypothetical protein
MNAEKSAEKLRQAAEREAGRPATDKRRRGKTDAESAEAHRDLTHPGLSKGRPPAIDEKTGDEQPSNAGTDGP